MPKFSPDVRDGKDLVVTFDLPDLCVGVAAPTAPPLPPEPQAAPAAGSNGRLTQETETRCYFVPRELAKRWSVCVDKVLRFIQTGELRAFNVASPESRRPRYRISIEEVRRFEEQTRSAAPRPAIKAPSPRRRKSPSRQPAPRTYF